MTPASSAPVRPILVVEDNDMDLDLLRQAFEENSVANPIVSCRDGEEALAFIERHDRPADPAFPLVALLDLRLPLVDGLDVLKRMKERPPWSKVPVVVLTTSRHDSDIERAYALGANSYIVKPVEFTEFIRVVSRLEAYWVLTNEPPFRS